MQVPGKADWKAKLARRGKYLRHATPATKCGKFVKVWNMEWPKTFFLGPLLSRHPVPLPVIVAFPVIIALPVMYGMVSYDIL